MVDKLLAVLSIAILIGFVSFVVVYVNEPDLWAVVLVVVGMAIFDFWRSFRPGGDHYKD